MARTILTGLVLMLGIYSLIDAYSGDTPQLFAIIGFWSGLIGLALSESIEQSKTTE